jgi:hypothetical protein
MQTLLTACENIIEARNSSEYYVKIQFPQRRKHTVSSAKDQLVNALLALSCKNRKKPINTVILWAYAGSFNVRACSIYSKHCTLKVKRRHNNFRLYVCLAEKENDH